MKALKKIISIILVFNILFSIAGVSRNAHYCNDKLSSLTYFTKAKCCCGDTEEDSDNCCRNERTIVQYKNDFILSQNISPVKPEIIASIFIVTSFSLNDFNYTSSDFTSSFYQAKCDYHSPPLYLQNSVFII
jgi:hypothetical protein